jgi:TPR repeat protein
MALAAGAAAQNWPGAPPVAPDLQAAMAQADAGSPAALVKLADAGRPDAQYYAGAMYLFGRRGIAPDPPRGCAYVEKAAASRADAMYLSGECYRQGVGGKPDPERAKAAFARAEQMGLPQAKCALGKMLLDEPGQAQRGLELCKQAANAGDVQAQVAVGDIYFTGRGMARDHAQARKWFEMAAKQNNPQAARKLGTMYADGDGGRRDTKKAIEWWQTAEKAGDPLAAILVADQLFSDLTGGKKPGPGTYAFRGGIPVADIEVVEDWYRQAQERDRRPEVKQRAKQALLLLASFKTAAQTTASKR